MNDADIKKIVDTIEINNNHFINNGKGVFITTKEESVLKRYGIDANNYSNIKSLLFKVEEVLSNSYELTDDDFEELDLVANSIAERNYYHYTNK